MADTFPEGSAPDGPKQPDGPVGTGTTLPPLRPPGAAPEPDAGAAPEGGTTAGNGSGTAAGSAPVRPEAAGPMLPPLRAPAPPAGQQQAEQPPVEQPAGPPQQSAPPAAPNRRGLWAVVWTVTAVIAVVAVVVVAVALGRSGSGEPTPTSPATAPPGGSGTSLQFAFPPGTAVYIVDRNSTGYVSAGKHRRPFSVQVNEVRNETPDDVNGHLGLDVESSTWGEENGRALQGSPFVVAPVVVGANGEITSGGDVPVLYALVGYEAGAPGTDMFVPAVPDRGLFPGEVWSTKYTRTYDTAGGGSIDYTAQNKFLGFNTKNGVRQARVITVGKMDVDVVVSVREFMKLAPGALNGQFSANSDPAVAFKGTIDYSITSLIDVRTHVLDRSDANARLNIQITEPPRTLQDKQVHLGLTGAMHVLAVRVVDPQATPTPGGPTGLSGPTAPTGPTGLSGPTG